MGNRSYSLSRELPLRLDTKSVSEALPASIPTGTAFMGLSPSFVQPLKNFPAFYETRWFISMFTRAFHWAIS
jgi:hypothetical protein